MIKVKISHNFHNWPIERQLLENSKIFENCKFFINEDIKKCDYWFVLDNLTKPEKVLCNYKNIVLITQEPPVIKDYDPVFTDQFNTVITCNPTIKAPEIILSQQAQPWHIGINRDNNSVNFDYNKLKNNVPEKNKLVSVMTSVKSAIEGHRKRYEFVMKLKEYFGNELDVYGKGINPIKDKYEAVIPYKYHIVIENCSINDYWTEKIADSFLGNAYPIYYGCKNIEKYFSPDSYSLIDIDDFDTSVKIIESVIKQNLYEKNYKSLIESKNLVLDKYNLFNVVYDYVLNNQNLYKKAENVILYPEFYPVDNRTDFQKFKHKPLKYILDKINL